ARRDGSTALTRALLAMWFAGRAAELRAVRPVGQNRVQLAWLQQLRARRVDKSVALAAGQIAPGNLRPRRADANRQNGDDVSENHHDMCGARTAARHWPSLAI